MPCYHHQRQQKLKAVTRKCNNEFTSLENYNFCGSTVSRVEWWHTQWSLDLLKARKSVFTAKFPRIFSSNSPRKGRAAYSVSFFLTSLFVEYPFGILDTVYFKSLILLSLILTFIIINLWSLFSEFHFIEWEIDQNYSWIRICIMPYFRSRFFKSKLFIMSFSSSIIGEAFFITLSREIKSTKLNFLRVYKFESSVFFQLISLVPLSLIIFRIIK